MDLNLDITPSAPKPLMEIAFARDLSPADLSVADAAPAQPAMQRLSKLRDTHHSLARALAAGMTNEAAALATGYTPVRISILKADPAFQELVAYYREKIDVVFADLHSRMSSFSIDLFEELRSRFEDSPDDMSAPFIHELLKTFADRTGFGPKTTQVNVNLDLAARLDAARSRAEGGEVIESSALPVPLKVAYDKA